MSDTIAQTMTIWAHHYAAVQMPALCYREIAECAGHDARENILRLMRGALGKAA